MTDHQITEILVALRVITGCALLSVVLLFWIWIAGLG
jgi:hypothetical protein